MTLKIRISALMLFLVVLFSGIVNGSDYNSASAVLLDRITIGEGTSDEAAQEHGLASAYDITFGYGQYSKPLSEMTIREVKQLQQQMIANGARSSAVGKYQIIAGTLKRIQTQLGLSEDTTFDATTQDSFGTALLEGRGYSDWLAGTKTDYQFQKNLALEWASIADPDTGKSAYRNNGDPAQPGDVEGSGLTDLQHVGTTTAQIRDVMSKAKSLSVSIAAADVVSIGFPVTLTLYVHEGYASGPTISDVQVTGEDGAGNSFEQTTNSYGYATITGIPGTWSFSASADGYETNNWDQEITETDTKDAYLIESTTPASQGSENSVVGTWRFSWMDCECEPVEVAMGCNCDPWEATFNEDGTISYSAGNIWVENWVQNGNTVIWSPGQVDPITDGSTTTYPTSFEGTINGNMMSGTSTSVNTYFWKAVRVDTGES